MPSLVTLYDSMNWRNLNTSFFGNSKEDAVRTGTNTCHGQEGRSRSSWWSWWRTRIGRCDSIRSTRHQHVTSVTSVTGPGRKRSMLEVWLDMLWHTVMICYRYVSVWRSGCECDPKSESVTTFFVVSLLSMLILAAEQVMCSNDWMTSHWHHSRSPKKNGLLQPSSRDSAPQKWKMQKVPEEFMSGDSLEPQTF